MEKIRKQLKVLRAFQNKYPKSHVGGSIGLRLLGVDLKRNLYYSDLDITTSEFTPTAKSVEHGCSPVEDFDYRYQIDDKETGHFFKLEIRIDDEQSEFDVVNYDGVNYNVTSKKVILSWKQKYAENHSQKHIDDLITIATGVRPKKKN